MADLTEIQRADFVKLVGSDATGTEQTPIQSTSSGAAHINLRDASGNEITNYSKDTLQGALNETAPANDTAPSGQNGRLQRIAQNITTLIGKLPATLGSLAAASSLAVTQSTEDVARMGIVTETAPANDTASSGVNGRLQRIAQNITTLIGKFNPLTALPTLTASGLVTRPIPYEPQTYSASANGFAVAGTPTDVFTIKGSATKTIRVHKIIITGTTTSGSAIKLRVSLIKRSTADTGGTSVSDPAISHDSTNASGTATVVHYTANPTLGTSVGVIRSASVGITNKGLAGGDLTFDFLTNESQPLTLRGTSEQLAINFNSISVTGSVISISVEWSEV